MGVFISVERLSEALSGERGAPRVVDATHVLRKARFDGDYRSESGFPLWEAERIPGSVHADIEQDFSLPAPPHFAHPSPEELCAAFAALGIRPEDELVVYDSGDIIWAARLWYLARWIGLRARILDGGLREWKARGRPVDSGPEPTAQEPTAAPARPTRRAAPRNAWIGIDEILAQGAGERGQLVCALSGGAYRGAEPTRYTRRGHIPRTPNVPARELFDERALLRPATELRARFAAAGVDLSSPVSLYCGGGISAAASAAALVHLGVSEVRIYDGSLEEWSARRSLPVVEGNESRGDAR